MKRVGWLLLGLSLVFATAACADDEEPRVSISVTDANVHEVLALIAKQAGLNISVDANVRGSVTVSLRDVTAQQALDTVAAAAGARVREDQGTYYIEPKPLPPERPQAPRTPVGGSTVLPPGSSAGTSASGGITAAEEDRVVTRLIQLNYADAAMLAQAFGGGVIGSGLGFTGSPFRQGGGRGGYGGYGGGQGYGGGRGYGNSGGYGSGRGSRRGGGYSGGGGGDWMYGGGY